MRCVFLVVLLVLSLPAAAAEQHFADLGSCELDSGAVIADCTVGYRTLGLLNADRSNAILVPTWFGGTSASHEYLVSAELLDPNRFFVILVDALGNGVSSSPTNSESQGGSAFPQISIRDMVRSQHRLATEVLELPRLYAVVGLSMGGMQAFQWAVDHSDFAERVVSVIGSPKLPAFDKALWETQIRLMDLVRTCECPAAREALAGLGLVTQHPVRSSQQLGDADVSALLAERANPIEPARTWDVQRQAEAMINHDIYRQFDGDREAAASAIQSKLLVIVGEDDRIVTPEPAMELAEKADATLLIMDNDCGHNEPGCDPDLFAVTVRGFLLP